MKYTVSESIEVLVSVSITFEDFNLVVTSLSTIKHEIPQSNADELKMFKDLLDAGVITQEEFDAKKKQLLGL